MPSLSETSVRTLPRIFCKMTFEARKSVMITEVTRKRLAQPGWGLPDIN